MSSEEQQQQRKPAPTPLLITGDDNGLIKVWDLTKPSPVPKVTFGHQTANRSVQALCWSDRDCTQLVASFADGTTMSLPTTTEAAAKENSLTSVDRGGICAATSSSLAVLSGKLIMATKRDGIFGLDMETGTKEECLFNFKPPQRRESSSGGGKKKSVEEEEMEVMFGGGATVGSRKPTTQIDACHIHRKLSLVAAGGKDNDLCVWDLSSAALAEGRTKPLFVAENVDNHVLGVAHPIYVTGCCAVDYHVFSTVTAYHQVRFYDRRLGRKPVQEFTIDREISRRPTAVLQWNSNKYVIGEAGGDVHLYDTRRGFSSRAKLRGAEGSIRSISKHPDGLPLIATAGLDRSARVFHVPTGQQIQQMHLKQMGTCCLMSRGSPAQLLGAVGCDATGWASATNRKQNPTAFTGWDELAPVADDMNEADDEAPQQQQQQQQPAKEEAGKSKAAAASSSKSSGLRRKRE